VKVVSNTSPLLNLALIGELPLLQRLFDKVVVPEAVRSELDVHFIGAGTGVGSPLPHWIETLPVTNQALVRSLSLELDAGEAEAIALAVEMQADIVLLDERLARRVGARLGLRFVGVLGLLVESKRRGLIPFVKPVLDALITRAGFWVGNSLYLRVLAEVGE
jgi:hypothetical protein